MRCEIEKNGQGSFHITNLTKLAQIDLEKLLACTTKYFAYQMETSKNADNLQVNSWKFLYIVRLSQPLFMYNAFHMETKTRKLMILHRKILISLVRDI